MCETEQSLIEQLQVNLKQIHAQRDTQGKPHGDTVIIAGDEYNVVSFPDSLFNETRARTIRIHGDPDNPANQDQPAK